MPLMLPAQSLLEPVDDTSGVELPPRFAEAPEQDRSILLMICDQCAVRRNLAEGTLEQCGKGDVTAKGTVAGVQAGCFPQFYAALAPSAPDFAITL